MDSMNNSYEYIIIGGGISGLYSAYLLNKIFEISNILIIEKSDRVGGRICTIFDRETPIELGASRISYHHNNMINLVNNLGLGSKLVKTPNIDKYYYEEENGIIIKTLMDKESNFRKIISEVINLINSNDENVKKIAENYSLYFFIEHFYDTKTAEMIKDQFGYSGDILHQSTLKAIEMFETEFKEGGGFYKLDGGLVQIINKLVENITNVGIKIMVSNELVDISENESNNSKFKCKILNKITTQVNYIDANKIIFALTHNDLTKIPFLYTSNIFNKLHSSVMNKPLMRVYGVFELNGGGNWYDDIGNIVTNSLIRQIKPIDPEVGIIMVSYSDTVNAEVINNLAVNDNELFKKEIFFHLRKLFPNKTIPNPLRLHYHFCESGTHIWKPSYDPDEVSKKIMTPFDNEHIYIVGEVYSPLHNWMEGAVISVNKLMKHLYTQHKKN
ncbi:MAG: amino oxidase family protein [Terrestrivirus sp.]|uniref:Amino oxidase family protein n=1 Tax=Terrestrivirus sp. TaxID=2487775 RepID=A0A3G4ZS84_9VIRU|nr:MAG: amino oxidase family protein [Terrestrivirus sp.]